MNAADVQATLAQYGSEESAAVLRRFFKTGPGQYGEGDEFIGVKVPQTRAVAKQFRELPLAEIEWLLASPIHEHRLCALVIMTLRYPRTTEVEQKHIYNIYMQGLRENRINNWDLIDVSAEHIVGPYCEQNGTGVLFELAGSHNLWERRAAIMATFYFIKQGRPELTLQLAEVLLHDAHDLIQKAVGWMLRETGKRVDEQLLRDFLDTYAAVMPRTMLRYAIERLDAQSRARYMVMKGVKT